MIIFNFGSGSVFPLSHPFWVEFKFISTIHIISVNICSISIQLTFPICFIHLRSFFRRNFPNNLNILFVSTPTTLSKQYYTWFYFLYSAWCVPGTSILWLDHFFWGHHSYPLHWYWFVKAFDNVKNELCRALDRIWHPDDQRAWQCGVDSDHVCCRLFFLANHWLSSLVSPAPRWFKLS